MEFQKCLTESGGERGKGREMEDMLKEVANLTAVENSDESEDVIPTSLVDLWTTTMRILTNKIFMLNLVGIVFYFYGCFPYWVFLSKYIEVQYRTSASEAK